MKIIVFFIAFQLAHARNLTFQLKLNAAFFYTIHELMLTLSNVGLSSGSFLQHRSINAYLVILNIESNNKNVTYSCSSQRFGLSRRLPSIKNFCISADSIFLYGISPNANASQIVTPNDQLNFYGTNPLKIIPIFLTHRFSH